MYETQRESDSREDENAFEREQRLAIGFLWVVLMHHTQVLLNETFFLMLAQCQ